MKISQLLPSVALAFYLQNLASLEAHAASARALLPTTPHKAETINLNPIIPELSASVGPVILNESSITFKNGEMLKVTEAPINSGVASDETQNDTDVEVRLFSVNHGTISKEYLSKICEGQVPKHLIVVTDAGNDTIRLFFSSASDQRLIQGEVCGSLSYDIPSLPLKDSEGQEFHFWWATKELASSDSALIKVISAEAYSIDNAQVDSIAMEIFCIDKMIQFRFRFSEVYDASIAEVGVNIGGSLKKYEIWPINTEYNSVIPSGRPRSWIDRLLEASDASFSFSLVDSYRKPVLDQKISAKFDLRGLRSALVPVAASCGINFE